MSESLALATLENLVAELKRRNISFLIVWADHNEFNKQPDEGIVWAAERGGNLVLQDALLRLLTKWHQQVVKQRTDPTISHE